MQNILVEIELYLWKISHENKLKILFIFSLFSIVLVYLKVLGYEQSIKLLFDEYILLSILALLIMIYSYCKIKLKDLDIINFINNDTISIKYTIIIFIIFQTVDFYYEDGFIGMISQWHVYWLFGIISLLLMSIINFYKNYKYFIHRTKN
jgi:hypothetical protein